MNPSIQRRLEALEGLSGHPCMSCALSRKTLADELLDLNTTERMTP